MWKIGKFCGGVVMGLWVLGVPVAAEEYRMVSDSAVRLSMDDGVYDLWRETRDSIVDLQTGSYVRKDGKIFFRPESSEVNDLRPSAARIVDDCTIDWRGWGRFRISECGRGSVSASASSERGETQKSAHFRRFPKTWRKTEAGSVELALPSGGKAFVKEGGRRLEVRYREGVAVVGPVRSESAYLTEIAKECRPLRRLKSRDGSAYAFFCQDGTVVETVFRKSKKGWMVSTVRAKSPATLKALAIAVSTVRPRPVSERVGRSRVLPLRMWTPADGSFTLQIPRGWKASGGTADLGANGYIRIVTVASPDSEAGWMGVYFPFYQALENPYYGVSGTPPMEPEVYVRERFFDEMAMQYRIRFPGLRLKKVVVDERLSEALTQEWNTLFQRYGMGGTRVRMRVVFAAGEYQERGRPYDLLVSGVLSYFDSATSMGVMHRWGPAPLYVETARKGRIGHFLPTFEAMAKSFQVSERWLRQHSAYAAADAAQIAAHYRKMAHLIHENSERRMAEALSLHSAESQEREEEFWDTFFALGGEERYEVPDTGEEVDLPIGADRYFYDRYAATWVGIRNDDPDADELAQHLKEAGWTELKRHTH